MRLAVVMCMVALLVAGTALAEKPRLDSKVATEVFVKPTDWLARPLFEGFNTTIPPAGWTAVVNNPYTWELGTYAPYEGAGYATCYYDQTYSGPQNEWLYYNYTIQAGDAALVFWAMGSVYWAITPYQNYNLWVTINGVPKWNYYDNNNGAVSWQWQQYTVSLAGYSGTIQIGLGYTGYDGAQGSFDALSIGEGPPPPPTPCCPFPFTCATLDYNLGPNGFQTVPCGGVPAPWQWGVPVGIPMVACDGVPVTHVLATNLAGAYPVSFGESVIVGTFPITPSCHCIELCHFYDFETNWDGGNVKVSADGGQTWTLVYPFGGYDGKNTSTYYPCGCVWQEDMFTGTSTTFVRDCFNLVDFIGQTVIVRLDAGSDSYSTSDLGWYVKWIKLGGEEQSPVESATWGAIKAMYR
ncbi:MAG: hypothetical protein FJY74_09525 [Candidatus Eisenbacteria bacterium]|nr:hypothetical protein [Candidatus Eisenbacteria bacterium]